MEKYLAIEKRSDSALDTSVVGNAAVKGRHLIYA